MCILHIVFCTVCKYRYCLYVNCFCTVWSTLSRISRISFWREHLSKVPDANKSKNLPAQVGYDNELQSGREPDEDDEHADELPWDGFWQPVCAEIIWLCKTDCFRVTIMEVKMLDVEVLGLCGYMCNHRCNHSASWNCSSFSLSLKSQSLDFLILFNFKLRFVMLLFTS